MKDFLRKYKIIIEYINGKLNPQQFLLLSSFLVGLTAAMAAVLLKLFVHYIQEVITYNYKVSSFNPFLYLLFPMIGILITVFIVKRFFKGELAKGSPVVIYAIHKKNAFIESYQMYAQVITSAFTVGFGGSTGIESPIVLTGSAIGSNYARTYQISYQDRLLLIASGTAAGIGAAFNAPVAGVLFAFEVLLANATVSAFIPIIIASATGAILSKIILGESILLNFQLKEWEVFNYRNVPLYIILAVLCGFFSVLYARIFSRTEEYFKKLRANRYTKAIVAGLCIAVLCLFFPPLFGEGYQSIKDLSENHPQNIFSRSLLGDYIQGPWVIILFMVAVLLLKAVATGITLGAGGIGGNFAPSLFLGAFVGFSFAYTLKALALQFNLTMFDDIPARNFALAGMAGVLSGIFHAPLTGIFLIAEITGGYKLFIPLMIVSAISYLISRYFDKYPMETKKLAAQGIFKKPSIDDVALRAIKMPDVMQTHFPTVNEEMDLKDFVKRAVEEEEIIFAVVNEEGKLSGVVNIEQLKKHMVDPELQKDASVEDVMVPPSAMILENEPMHAVIKKFELTDSWILPVVDVNLVYKGFIMRNKIFELYRTKVSRLKGDQHKPNL